MTLQDSCDTLYKSTRKLVFKIEENRCAVTGAAVLGGENKNIDRADAQSVFLTGMVDLPLRGINFDSTYPHPKNIPAGQTTVGNIWWGMVDLPLRGINLDSTYPHQIKSTNHLTVIGTFWWGMVDSNHRRRCQQIYSLSPLATREIPHIQYGIGAGGRIRTPDLLITNQLLYQLSYTSISISAVYSNRTFGVCQHIFYARNEGE